MSTEQFTVANVKCGGCVANIEKNLGALDNVQQVKVEQATGTVTISGEALDRAALASTLAQLGYPEKTA